ncbi:MAG: sulfite exporter TauE/SafE family protein [Gammaproteobacteria bacterium]|nr:sulfite exporter TauE/SafE family protein [Gammaproteobacteria bacterium]
MIETGLVVILWCAFALFCGGLIKGTLGVGTPLLAVPMMALVLPPQVVITIMALPVVITNVWQAAQAPRGYNPVARQWPTAAGILLGTAIGTQILAVIDERPLLLIVGILVLCFTFLQASRFQLRIPTRFEKSAGVIFGSTAGLIGGLSSMFGPVMILYLIAIENRNKERFVSLISFLYLAATIPWAIQLYLSGLLRDEILLYSAVAVVPVLIGMSIGRHLRARISEKRFNVLILGILILSGSTLIWRSLQNTAPVLTAWHH